MDKFITNIPVKMPVFLDDFRFLDETYRHAFKSLLEGLKGEDCILSGCEIMRSNRANYTINHGVVVINGEIYVCPAQSFTATSLDKCYFEIQTSPIETGNREIPGYGIHEAYLRTTVRVVVRPNSNFKGLKITSEKLYEKLVYQDDTKLRDSRTCNNEFDDVTKARANLSVYTKRYLKIALNGKAPLLHKHKWNEITEKPYSYPPSSHSHNWEDIEGYSNLFDYNHIEGYDDTKWETKTFYQNVHNNITEGGVKYRINRRRQLEIIVECERISLYGIPNVSCKGIPKNTKSSFMITSTNSLLFFIAIVDGDTIHFHKTKGDNYHQDLFGRKFYGSAIIPIPPSGNANVDPGSEMKKKPPPESS